VRGGARLSSQPSRKDIALTATCGVLVVIGARAASMVRLHVIAQPPGRVSDPHCESRIPNPESRIPNPESRVPSPESRAPIPDPRSLTPALVPGPRAWALSSGNPNT
jgi:hypothetical protein